MGNIFYERVRNVLCEFPLKENSLKDTRKPLSDFILLFGSLLVERVKAKLEEEFSSTDFKSLSANSSIDDICSIIEKDELNLVASQTKKNKILESDFLKDSFSSKFSGLGIDIEHISSIPKDIFSNKNTILRSRLFTDKEVIYSLTKNDPLLTLIGIYSAKESVKKALNISNLNLYSKIEINYEENGRPFVLINNQKIININISISHSNGYAISICIPNSL